MPTLKRLYTNDFPPEFQQLIEQLSYYINTNEDTLFQALTNNVSLNDNVYGQVVNLTVQVDATGKPISTTSFKSTVATSILGMVVLNAVAASPNIYPTSGIFCSFTQSGTTITINHITGLPANTSFTLTLATFG
jgi:hypothetical protein